MTLSVSSFIAQMPAYEPTPRKAACPKDRYPVSPKRMLKPIAKIPKITNRCIRSG